RRDQTGDFGGINVVGMLDGELNSSIASGNVVLSQGEWITRDDRDAIIVSQQFAELNGLTIGDAVTLTDAKNTKDAAEVTASIKGIFEIVHEIPTTMSGDTFRSENTFFSDLAFSQKITGNEDDPLYAYATFEVKDPNRYDEAGSALRDTAIDWARYTLVDDSGKTERLSQNFEGLSSVTYLFMIVVGACGLVLVTLSLVFWAKNRKHEMAILRALGCARRALVGQVLLEACTIALAGCLAAALLAAPLANTLVTVIAANQIEQTAAEEGANASRTAGADGLDTGSFQEANAKVTWQIIATSTAAVELMVILAVVATLVPLACKKPRTVLAELE
ncbi:MAG: FtsX-like permease family protein, partial [Raoultibacter sp.]